MENELVVDRPDEPGVYYYLLFLASKHVHFRRPELLALAEVNNVFLQFVHPYDRDEVFVYVRTNATESQMSKLCERCVGAKLLLRVWGESTGDWDELTLSTQRFIASHPEERINSFSFMGLKGPVRMNEPDVTFWVLPHHDRGVEFPKHIYFGREISVCGRDLIEKYTLKKRNYLGTTSMDTELSFFSANISRVKKGQIIFDPFAGTGSLMLGSAAFEAFTLGGDIDIRVLRGKEDGKSTVRFDFACNQVFQCTSFFDAIITDPPYGVRAGAKKVGVKKEVDPEMKAKYDKINPAHAQMIPYKVSDVLMDLYDFAARTLVLGGILSYWLPTLNTFQESDLPQHPCFEVLSNIEQPMQMVRRRRLITVKKILEYDPAAHKDVMTISHVLEEYTQKTPSPSGPTAEPSPEEGPHRKKPRVEASSS